MDFTHNLKLQIIVFYRDLHTYIYNVRICVRVFYT